MSLFDSREFNGHELVVFNNDEATALRAIIVAGAANNQLAQDRIDSARRQLRVA